jgi:putative ABC transport system permease protein
VSQPRPDNLSVRISPEKVDEVLAQLKASWEQFESRYPFEYRFVDETFGAMYADQAQLSHVLSVFALLAILVACLGLFGLASLLATKRTKEIGIRKTLGASVASILGLLTGEIVRLVAVATLVSVPLTLFLANNWLEGFAYRIEPSLIAFAGIAAALTLVGVLTVSVQSARAALADPVDALRYE